MAGQSALIQCTGQAATTTAASTFNPWSGNLAADVTETDTQIICRLGGVTSKLFVNVSANAATASTVKTRVGAGNGGQSAAITGSTTGIFQDVSGTDTVAAGDKRNYQTNPGSAAALTINVIQVLFVESSNTCSKLAVTSTALIGSFSASTTYFMMLNGEGGTKVTAEADRKARLRKAGTWKNISVHVTTASASTTHAAKLRDNGGDTLLVATCTANTTGWFEDTSDTPGGTAGHDYNYSFVTGSTVTSLVIAYIGVEFETTTGDSFLVAGRSTSGGMSVLKGNTRFTTIGGAIQVAANNIAEGFLQSYVQDTTFTASNLGLNIASNASSGPTNSLTLDKGGVATALSATFTTATGPIEDTADSVTGFSATDLLSLKFVNGDSSGGIHTIVIPTMWIHLNAAAPAVKPKGFARSFGAGSQLSRSFGMEPPVFG